ncbi:hypothetical protein [Burkholderia ubonensis]|uniref:hypothetical protein n=1 Tax=Burkholderia ubonensis TaxID=101571 RepID=UPI0012F9D178|nr:hypothetical protein [Burkholderia ubonensis]
MTRSVGLKRPMGGEARILDTRRMLVDLLSSFSVRFSGFERLPAVVRLFGGYPEN